MADMRTSQLFAVAVLGATMLAAGPAAAFSLQESGSGSAAAPDASSRYTDPGDLMLKGTTGGLQLGQSSLDPGNLGQGSNIDQSGSNPFGPKSGLSMRLQSSEQSSAAGANRYFSTEINPWK